MRTFLAALAVAALAVGCGDDPTDPAAAPEETTSTTAADTTTEDTVDPNDALATDPEPSGPGIYEFEHEGATGTVEVPTDPANPALRRVEEYRAATGAPEVSYFIAEVDNTNGTVPVNMYGLVVVTADGEQIEAAGISEVVSGWDPALPGEGTAIYNDNLFRLLPGATGTALLAAPGPVDSVSRVYVLPAGGATEVEASKR